MNTSTPFVSHLRFVSGWNRFTLKLAGALALLLAFALPASAQSLSGLDLGLANDYAFVSLGAGGSAKINSGPVTGSVLIGQGATLATSGGNNGGLTNGGILYYDNTASTDSSGLNTPPATALVSVGLTLSALNLAQSVSAYASGLMATQTFSTINSATTITGNGGINVIDLADLKNADLTISGGPNDYFVFNVSGAVDSNNVMSLTGGALASHILWNLTGSGTVFQTSGGNASIGTFLAVNGGDFQFSNLVLDGALINAGGHIEFVSGSHMTGFNGFTVPEPSTMGLSAIGIFALVTRRRRSAPMK